MQKTLFSAVYKKMTDLLQPSSFSKKLLNIYLFGMLYSVITAEFFYTYFSLIWAKTIIFFKKTVEFFLKIDIL